MPRPLRPERVYRVFSHDVWGNAKDGYEINHSYPTGETVILSKGMSDKEIVKALKEVGVLRRDLRMNMIQLEEDEEESIHITDSKGRPEFSLQLARPRREQEGEE